jgi:hypothetical protein
MQWEDATFRKISTPDKEGKSLKRESHERRGMKNDLKVLILESRKDGSQTVNAEPVRNEANSGK